MRRRAETGCWRSTPPHRLRDTSLQKDRSAIDGVSLTSNSVDGVRFTVNLIPHTLTVTTLSQLAVGASVNLEVDVIARYVERLRQPLAAR